MGAGMRMNRHAVLAVVHRFFQVGAVTDHVICLSAVMWISSEVS
jgi:hypothetical protein